MRAHSGIRKAPPCRGAALPASSSPDRPDGAAPAPTGRNRRAARRPAPGRLLGAALLATAALALPVHAQQAVLLVGNVDDAANTTNITAGPGLDFSTTGPGNLSAADQMETDDYIAQEFTTGTNSLGYRLEDVELFFATGFIYSVDDRPVVSVCPVDGSGDPDHESMDCIELTATSDSFSGNAAGATDGRDYDAPADTVLSTSTTYALYIAGMGSIGHLHVVENTGEDSDGATGWSLADSYQLLSSGTWADPANDIHPLKVKINGVVLTPPPPVLVGNVERPAEDGPDLGGTGNAKDEFSQPFTTGPHETGYLLQSVETFSNSVGTGAAQPYHRVSVCAVDADGDADTSDCTALTAPLGIKNGVPTPAVAGEGVTGGYADLDHSAARGNLFTAPQGTSLAASTTYALSIIGDASVAGNEIHVVTGGDEDMGGADGWALADTYRERENDTDPWADPATSQPIKIKINGVARSPNIPATGAPEIMGTPQAGETLTASPGDIMDADGLTSPTYSYQWIRVDGVAETEIPGETASTYVLATIDAGKRIRVVATFRDDEGSGEERASAATVAVTPRACTMGAVWCTTLTVGGSRPSMGSRNGDSSVADAALGAIAEATMGPRGYCAASAGLSVQCPVGYGDLANAAFALDGANYGIESLRWGTDGSNGDGVNKVHLTLDRAFPATLVDRLTLMVGEHPLRVGNSDGRTNTPERTPDNNYRWSPAPPAIVGYPVGLEVTVELLQAPPPVVPFRLLVGNADQSGAPQAFDLSERWSQEFTTGANVGGYVLETVEMFDNVTSAFPGTPYRLSVCGLDSDGDPDEESGCTGLTRRDLATTANMPTDTTGHFYEAPAGTVLSASTSYSLLMESRAVSALTIHHAASGLEDPMGLSDWSLANLRETYASDTMEWQTASPMAPLKVKINGIARSTGNTPSVAAGSPTFAGSDERLGIGEAAVVEVEFTEPVLVTGAPQITVLVGDAMRQAVYVEGSATDTLRFEYVVVEDEVDEDGLAIPLDSLTTPDGSAIVARDNMLPAILGHAAVAADPTRTVDGVRPTVVRAESKGVVVRIIWTEPLDESVTLTGTGGFRLYIEGQPGPAVIDAVVSGEVVGLSLESAIVAGTTGVTLEYVPQAAAPVRDVAGSAAAGISRVAALVVEVRDDDREPHVIQAWVDGAVLSLRFDEPLDDASIPIVPGDPQVFPLTVTRDGGAVDGYTVTDRTLSADGRTLALTLSQEVRVDDMVEIGYVWPLGGDPQLQDGATPPNLVRTNFDLSDLLEVENTTAGVEGAPMFAGPTGLLGIGDTVVLETAFSEAVRVTGVPQVEMTVGANMRQADYVSGSGGETLTFEYAVVEGDQDVNGIEIPENALKRPTGVTIVTEADGRTASLAHGAAPADMERTVDGVRPLVTDAVADGSSVTVSWSELLDGNAVWPGTGGFLVRIGASDGPAVDTVSVSGLTATLNLVAPIAADATGVTLEYAPQPAAPLRDAAGNAPNPITRSNAQAVTVRADQRAPRVAGTPTLRIAELEVRFDEALDDASIPAAPGGFTVAVTRDGDMLSGYAVDAIALSEDGRGLILTLSEGVEAGDMASLAYAKPSTPLRDRSAGANEVADFAVDVAVQAVGIEVMLDDASPLTEGDGARTLAVTVTLLGGAEASDVTATVTVEAGTASAQDFAARPAPLAVRVPAGATTGTAQLMLTAVDDRLDEDDETVRVHVAAADLLPGEPVELTLQDNDDRGVTVSPPMLELEEGASGTYAVSLDTQPTDSVTVAVAVSGSASTTANPQSLVFTTANWNVAQQVTVSSEQDADPNNETATVSHAVTGADYEGETAASVTVTVSDDDGPSTVLQLSVTPDAVSEGAGAATLTVTGTLNARERDDDMTVMLAIPPSDGYAATVVPLRVAAGSLSGTAQLTLTPTDDQADRDDLAVVISATTDAMATLPGSTTPQAVRLDPTSLTVTITDNDQRGVTVTPAEDSVASDRDPAAYTVRLDTEPTASVTVTATTASSSVDMTPSSLTFTTTNWDIEQTVTVRKIGGPVRDGTATVTHAVSGADYAGETAASVTVTVLGFDIMPDGSVQLLVPSDGVARVPENAGLENIEGVEVRLPMQLAAATPAAVISFRAIDAETAENTPPGYSPGDILVDIALEGGATLAGETARVCLPATADSGGQVFRYDESVAPPRWVALEPPAGDSPDGQTCGVTDSFSIFALGTPLSGEAEGWLARFGRTVAGQLVDAVGARINASSAPRAQLSLGGSSLENALLSGTLKMLAGETAVDARQALANSSFEIPLTEGGGARWTTWGRGAYTEFDGKEGNVDLDGEVSTGTVGMDLTSGDWLAGVALSHSEGDGDSRDAEGNPGEMDISLTTVSPYARVVTRGGATVWGMAGYGEGDLERGSEGEITETDLDMQMIAAGIDGPLGTARGEGSFDLRLKADAMSVSMEADAGERLPEVEADAQRFRLLLSGSGHYPSDGGGGLFPTLEAGVRWDEGDAETGLGLEIGAGMHFADASRRFQAQLTTRGMVAHEESDYDEWGVGGAVTLAPGRGGRGLALKLNSDYGPLASGAQALWERRDLAGLAPGGEAAMAARWGMEMSYGLNGPDGRGAWTPYMGYQDGTAAELTLGTRLDLGEALSLELSARRRDASGRDIKFNLQGRW